jgi:bacteriocin-like protein
MKTNSVKTGSEKNIEMFKMSNNELATITGGIAEVQWTKDENGEWVMVVVNKNKMMVRSFE